MYSIRPIALCEGPRDISFFTYRMNAGISCNSACYVWYIEGSEPKVLVDAGANAAVFAEKGIPETDLISVEDGLAKLGLKPEDIGIVIVTHLHGDHIALGYLYKNARFIIQKKELEYALNPHTIDAEAYQASAFANLNLDVIDEDRQIIPGVSVLLTPGHTPGGQSVKVRTAAGRAIIAGFCSTLSNFRQTEEMRHKGWEVAVHSMHHDIRQAYDSVLKVKREADIVIPLHEPAFIGKEVIP